MKAFSASGTIKATPATIWAILTDAASYPEFDPSAIKIEGRIAPGEKIVAHTKLSSRAFPAMVDEFVPNQRMTWVGGMPLGLFKGVRSFTLAPREDGSVDFMLREEFSGPLLPLFGRSIPNMTKPFEAFVAGLKARAEGGV